MAYEKVDGGVATYLGDGAYAVFDGYGIWLRANSHKEEDCTGQVFLDQVAIKTLVEFDKEVRK